MNHKCPKCGIELANTVKFCPECGTAQKTRKQTKKKTVSADSKATAERAKSGMQILYLVALLSLIVVIIYGYRYVVPEDPANPHANIPSAQAPVFDEEHYGHLLERVRANPQGFAENVDLGNFLFDNQRFEEAILYYDKAIQANSKAADIIVDLGVSYFNLEQIDKAKTYFEKALKVDGQHINALYNMGIVSARLGDMQEMQKFWQQLIEVAPGSEQAKNAQQMLDQMRNRN